MTDFGNSEERAAALCVALAAKELNKAISDSVRLGVNVEIIVLRSGNRSGPPIVQVAMERRTMILPTALEAAL